MNFDTAENRRRIAKNTLLLYSRMLIIMMVSLYTSRVVLKALGEEDFGIYNVVGGVVSMFAILSGSMSSAISRFITYELGTGRKENLNKIFSTAVTIQFILALIIVLFAETAGVWFLNVKMNIPEARMAAANWVLQFSILTFVINLISVPYNASIIAHEKMTAFAYISILEVLCKLAIAYLITVSPIDVLIFYALLMTIVALVVRVVYGIYCKRHFEECSYHFILDKSLLKRMFSFAGWNFIGSSSAILRDQGGNIVINLFCGPAVNAARGIAFQVNSAVNGFVTNFMTALNPQITKSYASGERDYMMTLLFQGARFSFYLLLLLSLPILVSTHFILDLWLDDVPGHTVNFVRLVLVFALSESVSQPLITAQHATGNIRNYQLIVGGLQMLNLPISYFLLRNGYIPESVLISTVVISQCCFATRLLLLRHMIGLSVKKFLIKVYFNVVAVAALSSILPLFGKYFLGDNLTGFIITCLLAICSTMFVIYFVGCNKSERKKINNRIFKIKDKIFNR